MNTLDPLIEGYLDYLLHVGRKAPRSVVDARCTLRGACNILARLRPGVPLWKLTLQDYLHWLDELRAAGRSSASLAKQVSQVRGLLEYAWRSGRSICLQTERRCVGATIDQPPPELSRNPRRFISKRKDKFQTCPLLKSEGTSTA